MASRVRSATYLPFEKLDETTVMQREIMEEHGIAKYSQQMFPKPTGAEHVNLLFHHPDDKDEYAKIMDTMPEMMDQALAMGGAPYTNGRQWGPHLQAHLGNTGYWRTLQALKRALDPNHIMNPDVVGL